MIYLDTPVTIIDDGTDRSIGIKFSEPEAGDEQIISGVIFRASNDTKTELNATWKPDKGTLVVDIPNNLINYSGYAKIIIPKTVFLIDAITMKLDVYSPKDTDGASRVHYGEDKYAFVRDFDTTSNQIFIEVATDIVNTDFLRSIVYKIVSEKGVVDKAGTAVDTDTLKNDILNRVTKLIDIKKIQDDIKTALVESINTLKDEQSKSLQNQESKLQGIETKVASLNAETIKSDILEALDTKILTAKTDIINSVDVAQLRLDLTTLVTETSKSDIAAAKQYVQSYLTTYFEGSDFTTKITQSISDQLSTISSDISSARAVADGAKEGLDTLKAKVEKNTTDIVSLEQFKTGVSGAIASYITENLTSQKIVETLKTNSDYINDIFTDMTSLLDAKYVKKADVTKVDTMDGTQVTVGEVTFTIPVTDSFAKETDLGTLRAKVGSVESSISTAIDTKLANGGDYYIKNSELHTALEGLSSNSGNTATTQENNTDTVYGDNYPYDDNNVETLQALPVGAVYVDRRKKNGAIKWIKIKPYDKGVPRNTARDCWKVLYGDTGEVLASITQTAFSGAKLLYRRINSNVELIWGGLSWGWFGIKRRGAAGYVAHPSDRNKFCVIVPQGTLPLGFAPTSSKIGNITNDKGVPYGTFYIGGNTDSRQIRLQFLEDVPDNRDITDIRFSNMVYITDEPWPDRL
mgnify:CR=1 FL=1|jgi:hypothetical protein|nr:MAG TPA: hypothetical protein [Caudoviricetes sp.]